MKQFNQLYSQLKVNSIGANFTFVAQNYYRYRTVVQ